MQSVFYHSHEGTRKMSDHCCEAMKSAMKAENPDLHAKMAAVEASKAAGGDVGKLFDGHLLAALEAWCVAHPDQVSAILRWVLAMAGIVLPVAI